MRFSIDNPSKKQHNNGVWMKILMEISEIKSHILPFTQQTPVQPPVCPYCTHQAIFNQGYWRCNPCDAQVKCFRDSNEPVGTLANKSLRKARKDANIAFGEAMQYLIDQGVKRHEAKKQITEAVCKTTGIPKTLFNIETFDAKLCDYVEKAISGMKRNAAVFCPYCSKEAVFIPERNMYRCAPCDAQVGIHKHNKQPLGKLANAPLRKARMQAHLEFDPLWKVLVEKKGMSNSKARDQIYGWLSHRMRIPFAQCHIGNFNEQQCQEVIRLCREGKTQDAVSRKSK